MHIYIYTACIKYMIYIYMCFNYIYDCFRTWITWSGLSLQILHATSSDSKDINSPLGFLRHLHAVMNLQEGGLAFMGVVCSSWTTVNRSLASRQWVATHVLAKGDVLIKTSMLLRRDIRPFWCWSIGSNVPWQYSNSWMCKYAPKVSAVCPSTHA